MSIRFTITEEEKNDIKSKYGIISEQSSKGFTISSIKKSTFPEATSKTYKVAMSGKNVSINGKRPYKDMVVTPKDVIIMGEGEEILFQPIPGFGQSSVRFLGGVPEMIVFTD
jgi:hypothetical protein